MSVDSIGDFLTIIRNGVKASRPFVVAPYSRIRQNIAQILKDEGFIKDFVAEEGSLKVFLKYVSGESVIHEIKRMSKPGRRRYEGYKNLEPVIGGLGISIITTSQGVITDREARQRALGGEVICTVW